MLNVRRKNCPLDYGKCCQTVTVYHQEAPGSYRRQVLTRAFLDFKKTQNVDKTGRTEASAFLLVIPCETQVVFPGDKAMLGEGPEIATREEWAALIPSKVPGLCVVKYADMKYWQGKICHEEAGG